MCVHIRRVSGALCSLSKQGEDTGVHSLTHVNVSISQVRGCWMV